MNRCIVSDQDKTSIGAQENDTRVILSSLMSQILDRDNLFRALRQVKRNKGAPGIDKMTVQELSSYLKLHWPAIRAAILKGEYSPSPVKRIEIPKSNGGTRLLGIPTAVDRLIQQAISQVLQQIWEPYFSEFSFGFRPGRSAHDALRWAKHFLRNGYRWVVDMDLEKFFDQVNHDLLISKLKGMVEDKLLLKLINGFLKSGVMIQGKLQPTIEGVPQGGPLSPLLSNIMLNDLDRELRRRGLSFVRYADDCNIYVKSRQSGERVLQGISRFVEKRLKLKVNQDKSAVDRPWKRVFLGFTFTRRGKYGSRIQVSTKAIKSLKDRVRQHTSRTRGVSIETVIAGLKPLLTGWKEYFKISETYSAQKGVDKWIRRRLRCYLLKQWGKSGYKELRKRGVSVRLAWNTAKSAHGPWRLSRSPALSIALPFKYFVSLGLPQLSPK